MKTSLKASLIATAIATLPFSSHAAGLGAINVFSGLGQPLRAEIELRASPQELQSLTARVASVDAFRQANVPYAPAISAIRIAVESRGDRSVLRVSSDAPVNDPFVDLLLEVNWSSGRLLREYTFLLDPVQLRAPAPVAAPTAAAPAAAAAPARSGTAAAPADADRYQVRRGDTLNRIAAMHRPGNATLEQTLVALFRDNRGAFDGENMNRLRAGAILDVPDERSVQAIDAATARQEVAAQSADFEAYRSRLAGTVAAREPVAEQAASQVGSGTIVPRVEEPPRPGDAGDRVKVSGAPGESGAAAGGDAERLARLQALEEELVARDKSLDEANSRLAELEKSIRDLQEVIELRNRSLAQLQGQATGGAEPVAAAPVAPQAAPAPVAAPAPAPAPEMSDSLLDDPLMLAGGGAIAALLLGYAGYRVSQRRKENAAATDSMALMSELPAAPNSVFGGTGGQNVDTSSSSVVHTDFSQSGLSAIDADEGVDPVAEADVYMAYGRDAQAEEILLDALKADASRPAIFLKLLEIYAQRKSLKQFETIATDLYSRTGGEGADWAKAAEMGRGIDPGNPLYSAAADAEPITEQPSPRPQPAAARAGLATATGVVAGLATQTGPDAADEVPPAPLSALDFTTSIPGAGAASLADATPIEPSPSQLKDTWAMPGDLGQFSETGAAEEPVLSVASGPVEDEALPDIDSSALDFDLDLGDAEEAGTTDSRAHAPSNVPDAEELTFDLDVGDDTAAEAPPVAVESADPESLRATVIGEGADFASLGEEFMPVAEMGQDEPAIDAEPVAFDMDATVVRPAEPDDAGDDAITDLEKTTFDSSLLDFDFDLDASAPQTGASVPALDLSGIDLELDTPVEDTPLVEGPAVAASQPAHGVDAEASSAESMVPDVEVDQEVDTKLELARAYEEMGDKEGARELIEEVLRDGSPEQRGVAERLLERLV